MQRVTISLPPELIERLKVLAAERGTSVAALIREAVEQKTATASGVGARGKSKVALPGESKRSGAAHVTGQGGAGQEGIKPRHRLSSIASFDSGRTDGSQRASEDEYEPPPWR